jgi:hypothetical protein
VYVASNPASPLRQAEILSGTVQYIYDPAADETVGNVHKFAVLASQECDLLRAHEAHGRGALIPTNGLLLFPASASDAGRKEANLNSALWAPTKSNANERYQVLEECGAHNDALAEGIPSLLVDFRNFFALTFDQLRYQLDQGQASRRAYLIPPYRDHFQTRAANYLARVPLDPPHNVA